MEHVQHGPNEDWFVNNFRAVPCEVTGNCSACVFRNTPIFCNKMCCSYIDEESDSLRTVYWVSVKTNANLGMWPELVKWFDKTGVCEIMGIAKNVMRNVVFDKGR